VVFGLGLLIVTFVIAQFVVPRPHFVRSEPAPSMTVTVAPSSLRITFDRELHPGSYAGVSPQSAQSGWGLDSEDPGRRTLLVWLESKLEHGLYSVRWRARTPAFNFAPFGTEGTFHFGVGVPVPSHLTARQWDEGSRLPEGSTSIDARFFGLFVGLVFLVLGRARRWMQRRRLD
jgi:methionine-rich copper-binding protein CopC